MVVYSEGSGWSTESAVSPTCLENGLYHRFLLDPDTNEMYCGVCIKWKKDLFPAQNAVATP